MKIVLVKLSGESVTLDVKACSTIGEVKRRYASENTNARVYHTQLRLLYRKTKLRNELTLLDYEIPEDSILNVLVVDRGDPQYFDGCGYMEGSFRVRVFNCPAGGILGVHVGADDTVRQVKAHIKHQTGIPFAEQRLARQDTELQDDENRLSDYGIDRDEISICRLGKVRMTVKTRYGAAIPFELDFKATSTIADVKAAIQESTGCFPPDQQRLTNRRLKDTRSRTKVPAMKNDVTVVSSFELLCNGLCLLEQGAEEDEEIELTLSLLRPHSPTLEVVRRAFAYAQQENPLVERTCTVRVKTSDDVIHLRGECMAKMRDRIELHMPLLFFDGQPLEDDWILGEHGIKNGSHILAARTGRHLPITFDIEEAFLAAMEAGTGAHDSFAGIGEVLSMPAATLKEMQDQCVKDDAQHVDRAMFIASQTTQALVMEGAIKALVDARDAYTKQVASGLASHVQSSEPADFCSFLRRAEKHAEARERQARERQESRPSRGRSRSPYSCADSSLPSSPTPVRLGYGLDL